MLKLQKLQEHKLCKFSGYKSCDYCECGTFYADCYYTIQYKGLIYIWHNIIFHYLLCNKNINISDDFYNIINININELEEVDFCTINYHQLSNLRYQISLIKILDEMDNLKTNADTILKKCDDKYFIFENKKNAMMSYFYLSKIGVSAYWFDIIKYIPYHITSEYYISHYDCIVGICLNKNQMDEIKKYNNIEISILFCGNNICTLGQKDIIPTGNLNMIWFFTSPLYDADIPEQLISISINKINFGDLILLKKYCDEKTLEYYRTSDTQEYTTIYGYNYLIKANILLSNDIFISV